MKSKLIQVARYLPLVIGLALLAVAAKFVPWGQVLPVVARMSPSWLAALVGLSAIYYFGRILRYWLILRMLGQATPFMIVTLACLVAQPVAVLPGGEMYRSLMLKRYGKVALKDGTASVFAQSLAESLGLVAICLVGAIVIRRYIVATTVIAIIYATIWLVILWYNGHKAHRVINLVPGVNVHHGRVRAYLDRNQVALSGWNFWILLGASLVTTGAGILIALAASLAIGHPLTLPQAALVYVLPVTFEIISFLPAGLGANEGSSVALLILFGYQLPLAVAMTLIIRLFTLGIGFGYGFAAMAVARLGHFADRA